MISRRLLYLDPHRLSAYAWQGGQLAPEGSFEPGEAGWRAFAAYLEAHRGSRFVLLADVADEGYALETVPFLRGHDRQALIQRKLSQHFLGTPLAAATSLGHEKMLRKNEKLLLSALTHPGQFAPWLSRIGEAEIVLAGIYSVAQLGGQLLGKLNLDSSRCLLLSVQGQAIRESFLINGTVHFSRLAPLNDRPPAAAFAAEAGKLHQYLIGQRLLGRDDPLITYLVAHPAALPAIEEACPEAPPLGFRLIDSHLAADKLGLHALPADNNSERLFLHLLATAPPRWQYAGEDHRHYYRLSQIRRSLVASGLIALLAGLLFAAAETYTTRALQNETAALRRNEAELDRQHREALAAFPALAIELETLRQLTDRYEQLVRQQRQPGPALQLLGSALDHNPEITLESIDWKNGSPSGLTATGGLNAIESLTVRASINISQANPRETLAIFERFLASLRANPELNVTVLQRPVDIEPDSVLQGGDGIGKETRARPFAVDLIRRATP